MKSLWNLGRKSLILLLLSPLLSIVVFAITPSTGSEWASGYNKLLAAVSVQILLLISAYIMGWFGVFYANRYKKSAYFVVSFVSVTLLVSFIIYLNVYVL